MSFQNTTHLRFIYVTDGEGGHGTLLRQVAAALTAGATMIRYNQPDGSCRHLREGMAVRDLCRCNRIPFVVQDNVMLAKALEADGVHLQAKPEHPDEIRALLGPGALVGYSLEKTEDAADILTAYDYLEVGSSDTGAASPGAISKRYRLPVVIAGVMNPERAARYLVHGAAGVAASNRMAGNASVRQMAASCGCPSRDRIDAPWSDEFGLIRKLLELASAGCPTDDNVLRIPPGDDACLLSALRSPVITTDTQREGVHFRLDWQTPGEIGQKAVAVTLSDLAACFAKPVGLFINLTLAPYVSGRTAEELYTGIGQALRRYGCVLGGGNISAGDRLALDLFAVGEGRPDGFPRRSGALPGDGLYCTGPLGLARAGLDLLIRNDPDFPQLVRCFKIPRPRFDAAEILADHGVACVTDISDGLSGDAGHIAEASNISIEWCLSRQDMAPELISYCRKYKADPLATVLSGGEDYELLFACKPDVFESLREKLPAAHQVGRCLPRQERLFINLPKGVHSFRHGSPVAKGWDE
ncbi:MAG: thiamine-phosphate kinase [Thermodesulfobacteriota bacterium]